MGSSSFTHILPMIVFTIIFILSSFQNAHISPAAAAISSEKVSGGEEREAEHATAILQKFRALLGLHSIKHRMPWNERFSPSPSPFPENGAPSPSSANGGPAPAPSPKLSPIHLHSHPPSFHPRPIPLPHIQQKNNNNRKFRVKILVAIVLSSGAALVVSMLLLIWFRNHQRQSRGKTLSVGSKKWRRSSRGKKSKYLASSGNKVSLNPGLDFLHPNSLGKHSEQETSQTTEALKQTNSSSSSASSSSTREIASVHGDAEECVEYESDGGKSVSSCREDKIIPIECHSSDDESFHSFVDSHSSNIRLSNASSAGSVGDPSGISPIPMVLDIPELKPVHSLSNGSTLEPNLPMESVEVPRTATAPPPPPPPPPLPRLSPPCESSWRSKITSTFPNLSSPRKSRPPQKSQSGIPPPPCPPPPFLEGNSSSAKGPPPPPPSQLPQLTPPLGKDGVPLAKLKPLHWDKVRAPPEQSMVWDKIRSSSFELDEEMIESLFGYNLRSTVKKTEEANSKTPSPSKHVLDPKRLQNITILSKALSSTADQVCDSLMRGDGLGLQQLEALAKMVPTNEEQLKLRGFKGNLNELGSAERYVKTLLTVPLAFHRVEAMLFRETFEDEVFHLRNSFSMLEEACKELRSSRLFLKLLEAVLKTGNRMNVGTIRGGARAFKLDALLKLSDVKGTDGKTTLLHFVVQEIIRTEGMRVSESIMGKINQKTKTRTVEEREENYRRMGLDLVTGLTTELYNVKKTATIDLDVLATSVSNLSNGISKLNNLVENELSRDERSRGFVESMSAFLKYAGSNLKEVKEEEDRVIALVREITEYFHGNHVSKDEANPLRIFVIVRDFLGMLDHVCKELRSSKMAYSPNPLAPFR
ncbi:unnamed protein product [Linum trigynum]|uniref:Formin-like protein n=2 Tax=Linum trigynum TaxID=586398 RepID=A0AAV2GD64_9ROSI